MVRRRGCGGARRPRDGCGPGPGGDRGAFRPRAYAGGHCSRHSRGARNEGGAGGCGRACDVTSAREGRADHPRGQRAQRDLPVPARRAGVKPFPNHAHSERRAVPRGAAGSLRRDARDGVAAPHLADGAEGERRFRHHDEQGVRDRGGALALRRAARCHRRGDTSRVRRAFAGDVRGRQHARAAGAA